MMFLWLPLLILVPFVFAWSARSGEGAGCCAMSDARAVSNQGPIGPDPMDILRRRLARGEITSAEYEEIRRALG